MLTLNMKKLSFLLLGLAALAAALPARAVSPKRETLVTRLDSCEAILRDLQANTKTAIPADILQRAKGLIILNQFQGGFFLGVKDGYAVAMVRRPNGKWSVPAFLSAGEISFGLQFGGKAINTVMVLMDDATARLLFKNRFNFGAEAKVVAGIRAAERERVTKPLPADANVLVYTDVEGYYVGAALKTGYMSPREDANRVFYNTSHRIPELLFSDWVTPPPETKFIMDYVTKITAP
jgi:lipid-binding SYLF domain-containing protein